MTVSFGPPVSFAPQATVDELRALCQFIGPDSCPRTYNFHMHSRYSDGQLTAEQIARQALTIGLKGFAITDHHSVQGFYRARKILPIDGPTLWTGVEINGGMLGCDVHILGYGFNPEALAMRPYLQGRRQEGEAYEARTVIDAIHRAGGLAVLAHPFRYRRPGEDLITTAARFGIDGIEAYYAYDNPRPWRTSARQTHAALQLAEELDLLVTCGTDTHGINLLQRL